MTLGRILRVGLALALLAVVACSDSDDQGPVDRPPEACLDLLIYTGLQWSEHGILLVTFGVDPLCSGDDVTRRHNLDARWDFEADGTWDTDWVKLEFLECVVPNPPPTEVWRVRMEARDEAGHTAVTEATMELPAFLPRYPDLGMSPVELSWGGPGGAIDFMTAATIVWGWQVDEVAQAQCALYVDGNLVHEGGTDIFRIIHEDCERNTLYPRYRGDILAYMTPGTHEITIVADAPGLVAEGDEDNNSQTMTVEIDADGFPVIPPAGP
jgi:hypothetical protein